MTQSAFTIQFDLRVLAPRERHPLISSAFRELGTGQSLGLINNRGPRPLQSQFQVERLGQFSQDYLEHSPGMWRVAIAKVASTTSAGHCYDDCGGGA